MSEIGAAFGRNKKGLHKNRTGTDGLSVIFRFMYKCFRVLCENIEFLNEDGLSYLKLKKWNLVGGKVDACVGYDPQYIRYEPLVKRSDTFTLTDFSETVGYPIIFAGFAKDKTSFEYLQGA
jgi:hypothetical protein